MPMLLGFRDFLQISSLFYFAQKIGNSIAPGADCNFNFTFDGRGEYTADKVLSVLDVFGVTDWDNRLEFYPLKESRQAVDWFLQEKGLTDSRPLIGINIGASGGWGGRVEDLWPIDKFIGFARNLAAFYDAKVIFAIGPAEKAVISKNETAWNAALEHNKNWMHTVECEIDELAVLMQKFHLFIGHTTGTAHLADAMGTPSITLFPSQDLKSTWFCPTAGNKSMAIVAPGGKFKNISVDDVMKPAVQLLKQQEIFPK